MLKIAQDACYLNLQQGPFKSTNFAPNSQMFETWRLNTNI